MKNNKKIINSANRALARELSSIKNLKSTLLEPFKWAKEQIAFNNLQPLSFFAKRIILWSESFPSLEISLQHVKRNPKINCKAMYRRENILHELSPNRL